MSAHTPGPWNVVQPARVLGCDARGQRYIHAKDVTVAVILDGDREANARLIAEAPALLDALKRIAFIAESRPAGKIALAAIAKATREKP